MKMRAVESPIQARYLGTAGGAGKEICASDSKREVGSWGGTSWRNGRDGGSGIGRIVDDEGDGIGEPVLPRA